MPKSEKERIEEINAKWAKRPAYDEERRKRNRRINNSINSGHAYDHPWSGMQYKAVRG